MKSALVFAGLSALACASAAPPCSHDGTTRAREPAPVAAWLEDPSEPWISNEIYQPSQEVIALGGHLSLLRVTIGRQENAALLDEARGVVGFVPIGDAVWLGIDGGDALYRALPDGSLERAPDAFAAAKGLWEKRGALPGARFYAAAGSVVAAAVADRVYVLLEAPESYRVTAPSAGDDVVGLFARYDGVIVAAVGHEPAPQRLFVSTDGGKTWKRSSVQTAGVYQFGAWISASCAGAVLSTDGKTWVAGEEDIDTRPLERALQAGETLVAFPRVPFVNQTTPAPPTRSSARAVSGRFPCGYGSHMTRAPRVRMGQSSRRCQGVECLLYRAEPYAFPTRTSIELLFDGLCDEGHENADGECQRDAPLVRAAHALIEDRVAGTAVVVDVPVGCRPASVRSGGGLAVLACEGESAGLFVANRTGHWHRETNEAVPEFATLARLQVAPDGTVLFREEVRAGHVPGAWVRTPLPLGAAAWRHLDDPDVFAYTVASAGRALVVTSTPEESADHFSVALDEPGGTRTVLARGTLGGYLLRHVCLSGSEVRLLVQTPERFEIHASRHGRFERLGTAAFPVDDGFGEVLDYLSATLCNADLVLLSNDLMNGAARP